MKIVDVTVQTLRYTYPNERGFAYAGGTASGRLTSLVRVTTDSGVTGLGTAYSHPDLVRLVVEQHLTPFLLGEDPCEVEQLWTRMYQLTRWYGRKGAALSALGALDIAFWDLRGKALGKPVADLLGAARRDVPAYASALLWSDDLDQLGAEAAAHVAQGYRRVKMRLGRSEAYDVAAVHAVRRTVGPTIDIMVDASMRYSPEIAVRVGKVLEEARVFWYEEPFQPEDIDAYVALRGRVNVPLAAGENEFGLPGFRELLRAAAVEIVQPDVCRAGGITECYRIGQLAGQHGARVATHTWSDAVAVVANMHLIAALPHGLTVEVDRTGNPLIDDLLATPLRVRDGLIRLPDGPGLGIELNEAAVERLTVPPDHTVPDGNYSDMVFGRRYAQAAPPYEAADSAG
jgi:L-alanine-DL-glutamate epimerase-like enolase superfamily enzyme